MLLALDVGNTNTVLGLYRLQGEGANTLVAHWRVSTHRTQTADEYGVLFVNLFNLHGLSTDLVNHIIISSVVPPVDSTLLEVCESYFHVKPLFVEPGIKTGMPVLVDNPTELGADRLVNAIAAYERYGGPCVVVDFGTATTFDCVTPKGEYLGGVIAPGQAADIMVLDWDRLSDDLVEPDVPALDLLLGRARSEHIKDVFVAGRHVVADGRVTGADLPYLEGQLLTALRAAAGSTADIRAVMPELQAAIKTHYGEPFYCF